MRKQRQDPVDVLLGYAADREGNGIAYARVGSRSSEQVVRVPFRVQRYAGLSDREVGYAAFMTVASFLHDRGVSHATFALRETDLLDDVRLHRDVPPPLVLPYVRLRCMLNRFASYALLHVPDGTDLEERARAEVALRNAA